MNENELSKEIIGAAMKVHSELGLGLLESVYETCLDFELRKKQLEAISKMEFVIARRFRSKQSFVFRFKNKIATPRDDRAKKIFEMASNS